MKTILSIIACALLCLGVNAGTIDSSGFDTNVFVVNKSAGTVRANTNANNPKALMFQAQASQFDPAGAAAAVTATAPSVLYVETNGNDATAVIGQRNHAWKTFTNALSSAVAPAEIILGVGTFFMDASTNGSVVPSNVSIRGQGVWLSFLMPGNLSLATTNVSGPVPFGLVLSGDNIELSNFTCGTNANNGTYYIPIALAKGTNQYLHQITAIGDSDGIWGNGGSFTATMNTNCSGIIDDVKVVSGFDGVVMVAVSGGTNSQWRIQNTRIIINGDINFPSVQNRGIFLNHLTTTIQNCNITVNSPQATQVYGILVGASGITNNLTLGGNFFDVKGSSPTWLNCGSSHAVTTVRGLLDPSKVVLNGSVINWDAGNGSGLTSLTAANLVGTVPNASLPDPMTLTTANITTVNATTVSGNGSGLTGIPVTALSTNGGTNGQVVTMRSDGTVGWSNAPASGGGSQTPITSNIDFANHDLFDLNALYLTNSILGAAFVSLSANWTISDDGAVLSFGGKTNSQTATASLLAGRVIAQDQIRVNNGAAHITGGGSTPTIAAGAGDGTGGTVSIDGTDLAGKITMVSGTLPSVAAVICTVTNAATYGTNTYVVLWPGNASASALTFLPYAVGGSNTWTINAAAAVGLGASTTYIYNYQQIGKK